MSWILMPVLGKWIDASFDIGYSIKEVEMIVCPYCKSQFGRVALGYDYCPNCGEYVGRSNKEVKND